MRDRKRIVGVGELSVIQRSEEGRVRVVDE
jgi:hypothetical protein